MDSVISARKLTKRYGSGDATVYALREVSVDVARGKWTSIMGPSGSGKTTLLHTLSGLSLPTSGAVTLSSGHKRHDLTSLSENRRAALRRTNIGVVFQEFNLVPVLNVQDNIRLPLRLAHRKIDKDYEQEIVTRLGLGGRLKHLPHQLSGGQRQRVAIARALLPRPDVIFADEPTGNLDSEAGEQVLSMFRELVDAYRQTLVVVTHDPAAADRGDDVIRMRDGQVVA
ncbi:ABC transporter ATP-binding protein [Corynebacterium epidermidicanis]|uniref:ABC-type antimicrobial peptide transport system, ATPase component n=1 Tax=Corynebacterium epidermidicanis TaxID=1050174 RepID=A0A0G3GLA2_9CORY|nr:ABC transporter ATP-binding protein [Corynebacterium epidermidicanis]AKK02016.1 ABC-type antimicrobial peptide transport system, ATPase component [Corynebacterium epidermidicanis]